MTAVPATNSPHSLPFPAVPRPFPAVPNRTTRAVPRPTTDGERERVPVLAFWLANLKARNLTVGITAASPQLQGPLHLITPDDATQLQRHHHALVLAATATHPHWWTYTAGLTTTQPTPDQLPTLDDDSYPCATCGQPADYLGPNLLAWCHPHAPHDVIAAAWKPAA